jgi:DNA replication protein DnaC
MTMQERDRSRGGEPQHIGKILTQLQRGQAGQSEEKMRRGIVPETKIEECECKTCGNKFQGEVTVYSNFRPPKEFRPWECPKCKVEREALEEQERQEELEKERQQIRERWRAQANLPQGLQCTRFEEWDKKYNRHAYEVCLEWAENFDIENPWVSQSILLYSEVPGVGKTSLMVCIANYIIDNWKGDPSKAAPPLRLESGPSLVRRIRNTYNLRQGDDSHEREEDVYNQLSGVKILILDDVGKETPSRFTRDVYWYIIDERLKKGLPVLITSRLPIEGDNSLPELMGEDTVDRIYGMCRGKYESLKGLSYRKEKKVP